ncbi:hypothetical protein EIP91_004171 [Steccherinum ochraceum]|uniref:Enoyl reductase (ER) domain-containing protein n=1 Tax=Steccherinum ochraceum TaxID=92696 RepID=A0A4R0RN97_9APHY|nr:hypothetical protein EIP91_004171 [Steccherinum ochraceum]
MPPKIPTTTRVLLVKKATGESPKYLNDAVLVERQLPPPNKLDKNKVLIKINAASYNHRDLWVRKGLYPGIKHGSAFGGDGAGVVIASGLGSNDKLLNKRVFLVPTRGWKDHPEAPESRFSIIGGGGDTAPLGTFAHYLVVEREHVIESPSHLTDEQVSAWPVGGVTAWRAVVINADVQEGQNVLITGIGGGVALIAMQLCLARGANVYVSSGNSEKIGKAVELGAKGGVNYKDKDWANQLSKMLKEHNYGSSSTDDALLSAVIDSGGGDIMGKVGKFMKGGGKVVIYGMTAEPKVTLTMREVLKNQRLIGSTMGSHKDLVDATNFIAQHKIVPVVSHVLDGLESADEGFKLVEEGTHFGKVVIRMRHEDKGEDKQKAKL